MFWIIISFLISNFRNLEKFGNEILKASPVDSLKEEQTRHFQFPFRFKCSVNVAKPFNFLFPNNWCLAWKWLFLYGFFNPNYKNTDFTFCINIFFLCCLLHDDNKKTVFTEKKKHLNEMYVGFGIVFHLCANSVRLLFPIIKSPNKANRT